MSPEDQQAIIEALKREYADKAQELRLLKIQLDSIGRNMMEVGRTLIEKPTEILQISDLTPGANEFYDRIQELLDRLRELEREVPRLAGQLRSVGVHVGAEPGAN